MRFLSGVMAMLGSGCLINTSGFQEREVLIQDADGDGVSVLDGDCDDFNSEISPNEAEICDGVDNNCDDVIDESGGLWFQDVDGDGFGNSQQVNESCAQPEGYVSTGNDCDDSAQNVYPSAEEFCDDVDNDCDGLSDEAAADATTWFPDGDGDGYGDASPTIEACAAPEGYVALGGDCDDSDPEFHPGADESDCTDPNDYNCDGSTAYDNADGDDYIACEDCNDADASVHPGAAETCDGVDNNCSGDESDASDASLWFGDVDGDGYGDPESQMYDCEQPSNSTNNDEDCDDEASDVNPGADEVCNDGVDNDCDGGAGDCELSGEISLADADAFLVGVASGDSAGSAISGGDVNGDGYDDILIGADGTAIGGTSYLVFGPVTGAMSLSAADATLTAESSGDNAGASVSVVGDVDGDGYEDVVVGAYAVDSYAGAAYLVLGPISGSMSLSSADAIYEGDADYDYAGVSVSAAGDIDGDGNADWLMGTSGGEMAYLITGFSSGDHNVSDAPVSFEGENDGDNAGAATSAAGDVNGDGHADVLIGAYGLDSSTGAAYLILGPTSGSVSLSSADAKFLGESSGDNAGEALSAAGDVNNDGFNDIIIGSYSNDTNGSRAGATYLILGPTSGSVSLSSADAKFLGESSGDNAGGDVSGEGDIDGDSFSDIIIGAKKSDLGGSNSGTSYLIYGPVSGTMILNSSDVKFTGENESDFASITSLVSDINSDGNSDILIGAWGYNKYSGAVYLLNGLGI